MKNRLGLGFGACALVLHLSTNVSPGAVATRTYYGTDYPDGVWGSVATGSLKVEDKGDYVFATFNRGKTSFDNSLVFYLDTGAPGFGSTANFPSCSDYLDSSVTANSPSGRATVTFASPFRASYAIGLTVNSTTSKKAELYRFLDNNGTVTLSDLGPIGVSPYNDNTASTYTFRFNWSDIGEADPSSRGFRFESAYTSRSYNYAESFEQNNGVYGSHPYSFSTYDVFGVEPVPETTNAALAAFAGIFVTAGLATHARRLVRARVLCRQQVARSPTTIPPIPANSR